MCLQRPLRQCCFVWLLALFAMLGQIVGATAIPAMADTDPFGVICSVDTPVPAHAPVHHHRDCAVCPLCAAAALHVVLASPAPLPRARAGVVTRRLTLPPPARPPPAWQFHQPFPQGPPAFA